MISTTSQAGIRSHPATPRNWRIATGLTGVVGGAVVVAGAFVPWVETFAGLIAIPGVRGGNGRILLAMGILIAAAGLYHAVRGGRVSRWLTGVGGFAALAFSGYLLIQLAATMNALGGNSMVLARGGPGLWVCASGALLAFATMFLPAPAGAPAPRAPAAGARISRMRVAVARRTADWESAGARRGLQVALGLVWLLDGALQLQPYMFGKGFTAEILMPAAMGSPAAVAGPAMWAARLIGHDVAAWNTAFAVAQLAIGLGLLWRPAVKAALAGSIAWALPVWWLGEGLGGLLTGTASPVTGAPGAVILYALIAVLVWPRGSLSMGSAAAASPLGRWSRVAWLVLWGSFACLILQPAVRAPRALHGTIAANAAGEPGWLAIVDRSVAAAIGSHGTAICAAGAVLFVLIAAGILVPAAVRPALVLAVIAALACWVVGENFGQVLTGRATDPSTGPLLVLLAACYWPRRLAAGEPVPAAPARELAARQPGSDEVPGG